MSSINGQKAEDYLIQSASGLQDLDALYNSAVYSPAFGGRDDLSATIDGGAMTEQSETTVITFDDGTKNEIEAIAQINPSYATGLLVDGPSIWDFISSAGDNATDSSTPEEPASTIIPLGKNYPDPIVKSQQNYISGYFLNESENSDVAVLSVASFDIDLEDPTASPNFLGTAFTFLAKCATANKKRLIVDLRNNPGGSFYDGYSLFQLLFPNVIPYSGVRFRASDVVNALGEIGSSAAVQRNTSSGLASSSLNVGNHLQPNGSDFKSWQQFYGPMQQHRDLFSNVGAFENVTNGFAPYVAKLASNRTSLPSQVFSSESITLVST